MSLSSFTNKQKVLLGKVMSDDSMRKAAKLIGSNLEFEESLFVRIRGVIKIGAKYDQGFAKTFPWQRMALMLATRVPRHVLDAVLRGMKTSDSPDELKDHVIEMWADINADSQKECNGKVTGRPFVEVFQPEMPRG